MVIINLLSTFAFDFMRDTLTSFFSYYLGFKNLKADALLYNAYYKEHGDLPLCLVPDCLCCSYWDWGWDVSPEDNADPSKLVQQDTRIASSYEYLHNSTPELYSTFSLLHLSTLLYILYFYNTSFFMVIFYNIILDPFLFLVILAWLVCFRFVFVKREHAMSDSLYAYIIS